MCKETYGAVIAGHEGGHPILFRAALIPDILHYGGEGGLKGAFASLSVRKTFAAVEDEGAFLDADTREGLGKLTELCKRDQS